MSEVIDNLIADWSMTANCRSGTCLRPREGSFWRMIWQSRWDTASVCEPSFGSSRSDDYALALQRVRAARLHEYCSQCDRNLMLFLDAAKWAHSGESRRVDVIVHEL